MSIDHFKQSRLITRKSPNLTKLGFDFSNTNIEREYLKIQSILYTEYHILCESMLTIMKKFNIPSSKTMDTLFKLFDIESRSLSNSALLAVEKERSTLRTNKTFTNIYHTSWFGEVFFLRSSYELAVAKYFDSNQTKYQVEALRIKYFDITENKYRIAIPDFYLPETNTIVEVKSTYWYDQTNMDNKRIAYKILGYNFQLHLDGNWVI